MKNEKIISLNLILSLFVLNLSFFYFGLSQYNYVSFNFSEIILSSIYISVIIALPLILILILCSKFYFNFKKVLICILVGLLTYIVFHYLIRFSDINYNYVFISLVNSKNIFVKVFFYFFPFIITFLFLFKLNQIQIFKINKFFLILLIIFNILSIYRNYIIYVINDNPNFENSDFKNFEVHSNNKNSFNQKVFILLFDEFDQFLFNKNLKKFNNIKNFYSSSYVNKNFYSPAKFTIDSIPAILTGNSTKRTIIKKGNLYVKNLENEIIHFNHENSLFNINNSSYGIFAFYHPYCKIFAAETCYDKFYFMKQEINLKNALDIFLNITYIDRLINLDLLVNKSSNDIDQNSKKNYLSKFVNENNLSKFMIDNSLNFLKSNNDIIYVHYPFPHPPLKRNIINLDEKYKTLSDYEKNLFLVDYTFSLIEKFLNKHEGSLLIVLSDHWHKDMSEKEALPTVFFSKVIGDNNYIEDNEENNSSNLKGLLKRFFEGKIISNNDINNYFKKKSNHKTYVR